jgi:hypothetical protein
VSGTPVFTPTVTTGDVEPEVEFLTGIAPDGTAATTSFWADFAVPPHVWGGTTVGDGAVVTYAFDASAGYSATEMATVGEALALWSAIANISFVAPASGDTPEHALILAEGVATETFLETAEAARFDNWSMRGPPAAPAVELPYPRVKAQRQLPESRRRRLGIARAA